MPVSLIRFLSCYYFKRIIFTRGTTSQLLGSISFSFFFFYVAISDSVQWLSYLGFVPGPTRTTSKGLMSLLFDIHLCLLWWKGKNICTKTLKKSQSNYRLYSCAVCKNHCYLFVLQTPTNQSQCNKVKQENILFIYI